MRKGIVLFIIIFIFWLLLTWSTKTEELIAGLVISFLITIGGSKVFYDRPWEIFNPRRIFWFLLYIPYMGYQIVLANLDVAYRVLHPELPIRPGIVRYKTKLRSSIAKTFLANSITLTPGTFTVDIVDDTMYIHWINIKGETEDEWHKQIAGRFEGILRRIFE
ncbi:MAG: Na+/H+ antiporter subunit E [bacterium]